MSAIQHEEAAEKEQRAAAAANPCRSVSRAPGAPCWSSNEGEIAKHEQLAAEHRHEAELRRAEEQACVSVAPDDRRQSPFSHQADIVSVQPLVVKLPDGHTRDAGAVVVFRKVPGLTSELLTDIVECQLARNAALGLDRPDLAYCPLTVNPLGFQGLKATVTERPDGFALQLTVEDEAVAREVLHRAQRAAGPARCLRAPADTA